MTERILTITSVDGSPVITANVPLVRQGRLRVSAEWWLKKPELWVVKNLNGPDLDKATADKLFEGRWFNQELGQFENDSTCGNHILPSNMAAVALWRAGLYIDLASDHPCVFEGDAPELGNLLYALAADGAEWISIDGDTITMRHEQFTAPTLGASVRSSIKRVRPDVKVDNTLDVIGRSRFSHK